MQGRPPAALAVVCLVVLIGCADDPAPRDPPPQADWWLDGPADDDELDLAVYGGEEGCHAYRGVDVTEFEDEVRITAHVDVIGDADCVGPRQVERVVVPLAEPLSDRDLTGCAAPEQGGLRDPRVTDHDEVSDCRGRTPPR